MELLDIMRNRRSIRKYTEEDIPEESLTKVLQAGLLARIRKSDPPMGVYRSKRQSYAG